MEDKLRYGVLGGGSWGTALVKILSENVNPVAWYMRNEAAIRHIKKEGHNPHYISSVKFQVEKLALSHEINKVVEDSDVLILAIPSAFLEKELHNLNVSLQDKIIFSAVKGVIPGSGLTVGEHFYKKYNFSFENLGVIAGPCHAEEVALERLSYLTIGCTDLEKAQWVAQRLKNKYIRTKISDDSIGMEYAAMLKNIYAIAAGIAHGLGYGDNFQSVLMSNAIREMKRFMNQVYKTKRNINDSAYLGDLLVTGYSTFSRNRTLGTMIGKGYTVKSALMEMNMIAEGYYATQSAQLLMEKLEKKSKTPIINTVYQILYKEKDPKREFTQLTEQLD